MTTITGHQVQFRPTERHAWRIVYTSVNPIMAPALDALPDVVRREGAGFYQIVKILSDGRWSVPFSATLLADAPCFGTPFEAAEA